MGRPRSQVRRIRWWPVEPPRSGRDDVVGEVFANVSVVNPFDRSKRIECKGLVDTGSAGLVLPMAWKEQLGDLDSVEPIHFEVADQRVVSGEVAGPVNIQLDGFRRASGEVFFMHMLPDDREYRPLIGYLVLEQSLAVVDMVHHRLVPGRPYFNLKAALPRVRASAGARSDDPRGGAEQHAIRSLALGDRFT